MTITRLKLARSIYDSLKILKWDGGKKDGSMQWCLGHAQSRLVVRLTGVTRIASAEATGRQSVSPSIPLLQMTAPQSELCPGGSLDWVGPDSSSSGSAQEDARLPSPH
jgi:hypothetical protein